MNYFLLLFMCLSPNLIVAMQATEVRQNRLGFIDERTQEAIRDFLIQGNAHFLRLVIPPRALPIDRRLGRITSSSVSDDGKRILLIANEEVVIIDLATPSHPDIIRVLVPERRRETVTAHSYSDTGGEGVSDVFIEVCIDPRGNYALVRSELNVIFLNLTNLSRIEKHKLPISEKPTAICLALNGQRALVGHETGKVSLWNPLESRRVADLNGHETPVSSVFLRHDGNWGLTQSRYQMILWNATELPVRGEHILGREENYEKRSPNGRWALSVDREGYPFLVDFRERRELRLRRTNDCMPLRLHLTNDWALIHCRDGSISLRNLGEPERSINLPGSVDRLTSVCLTTDFAFLVYSNGTLTLLDLSYHTKFTFPDLLWHILKGKNPSLTDSERVYYLGADFAQSVNDLPIPVAFVENVSAAVAQDENVSDADSHINAPVYQMILRVCLDEELASRVFRRAAGKKVVKALSTDKEFQDYLHAGNMYERQERLMAELNKCIPPQSLRGSQLLPHQFDPESRVSASLNPLSASGLGRESEVNREELPKASQQVLDKLNPFLPLTALLNLAPELSDAVSKLEDEVKREESSESLRPEAEISASDERRPVVIGSAPEIKREELRPSILNVSQQVAFQEGRQNVPPASRESLIALLVAENQARSDLSASSQAALKELFAAEEAERAAYLASSNRFIDRLRSDVNDRAVHADFRINDLHRDHLGGVSIASSDEQTFSSSSDSTDSEQGSSPEEKMLASASPLPLSSPSILSSASPRQEATDPSNIEQNDHSAYPEYCPDYLLAEDRERRVFLADREKTFLEYKQTERRELYQEKRAARAALIAAEREKWAILKELVRRGNSDVNNNLQHELLREENPENRPPLGLGAGPVPIVSAAERPATGPIAGPGPMVPAPVVPVLPAGPVPIAPAPAPVVPPAPGLIPELWRAFTTEMAGGAGRHIGVAGASGIVNILGSLGSQRRDPISNNADSGLTTAARETANDIIRAELGSPTIDLNRIIKAIEAGGDPNTFEPKYGLSPLLAAVSRRDIGAIDRLLMLRANPSQAFANGTTPLMMAASQGESDAVRLLLKANVDLNALSQSKTTALDCALELRSDEVFKLVRSAGAKLGAERSRLSIDERDESGRTALVRAVHAKNVELVWDLLDQGAGPLIQDNDGISALWYAQKHPEILRLIQNSFLRNDSNEFSPWVGSQPVVSAAQPKQDVVVFSNLNEKLNLDEFEPITRKTWASLIRGKRLPYAITVIAGDDRSYFFDADSLIDWVRNRAKTNPITGLPIDPSTVSDYILTALKGPAMRAERSFMVITMDLGAGQRLAPAPYEFPPVPSHPVPSAVSSSPASFRGGPSVPSYSASAQYGASTHGQPTFSAQGASVPSYSAATPPYGTTYLFGGKDLQIKAKAEAAAKAKKQAKKATRQAHQKKCKRPGRR